MSYGLIKKLRRDISDYVLHSTRNKERIYDKDKTFGTLKKILEDGFFWATDSTKLHSQSNLPVKTVEGNYPAVSFTETPLEFFIKSIEADHRYTEFCIAVRKDELFAYGGRPVIYNDRKALKKLDEELKYLWVTYDHIAHWDDPSRQEPIDWTHEREWRTRSNYLKNKRFGLYTDVSDSIIKAGLDGHILPPLNRVPVFLPNRDNSLDPKNPHFVILVDTTKRKKELIEWILHNGPEISEKGGYWQKYALALGSSKLMSFEEIRELQNEIGWIEGWIS